MNRLAYILGASHSGTTLLAMLLGAHPEGCTVGQAGAAGIDEPERYRCSCGQPIRECRFWSDVKAAMQRRGLDFDIARPVTSIHASSSAYVNRLLDPLHRGPLAEIARDLALSLSPVWRKHLPETQRRYAALVDSLCEITKARAVLDSSKTGVRLKYLLRNPGLDVRVIWFVRDGRGVSLTYVDPLNFADAANPHLRAGGFGGHRDSERLPMQQAAREWRRSNEEAAKIIARLPRSQWIQARYEDLCRDPRATLTPICEFLGLDPARINLEFRSRVQHVVGNGMRLDTSSEIRLDERWRTHLSPEQLDAFEQEAGALNRSLGYT